jgi:hypothetical protein
MSTTSGAATCADVPQARQRERRRGVRRVRHRARGTGARTVGDRDERSAL